MKLAAERSVVNPLARSCRMLMREYPVAQWWPASSPFEVMIGAILVQNTRWRNVTAAIEALSKGRCLTAQAIHALSTDDLQTLIRSAGCQSVKARRLKALAARVRQLGDVSGMALMETSALRDALLTVKGVGAETADAILCFAFDRPLFIADQYARRWLQRMGFVSVKESQNYAATQHRVNKLLRGKRFSHRDLHAGIVLHGQAFCGRSPQCSECFIKKSCKTYIKQ